MKLLYKHIFKEFITKRSMLGVLSLFLIFISFMYFFVHFSIDKNLTLFDEMLTRGKVLLDNEEKYFIALENNQILIRNITLAMVGIFSLILFLFIKNIIGKSQIKIGYFLSLGFLSKDIIQVYVSIITALSFVCSFVGLILGFFGSNILISANAHTYLVNGILKGIHFKSFIMGTILTTALFSMITYLAGIGIEREDVALMIKHIDMAAVRPGIVEKIIQKLPIYNKFSYKLTMKNKSAFVLLVIAIVTFNIMFILSVSLVFSSFKILESQRDGRSYLYNIYYDDYQTDDLIYSKEAVPYLKYEADIEFMGNSIKYNVVGLDNLNEVFHLLDEKGRQVDTSEGIVLNPELEENYGIKVGDLIYLVIKGKRYEMPVTAIGENAALKTVYVSKTQAAEMIQRDDKVFNGVLTNHLVDNSNLISFNEEISAIERSLTSNKASALINQSIGIITGCLLIYLSILIGLSNNISNILIFDLLGYNRREINKIILDPYIVMSNILFLLTFPFSAYAAKRIQIMTSIQTNEYMPFQINILTFIYMIFILNILCFSVRALFMRKVRKIVNTEQQAEFLTEW